MGKKITININILLEIAKEAGDRILEVYNNPATAQVVDFKADDSPLTLADRASHTVISQALKQYFPAIPVLSEEDQDIIDYDTRKNWLINSFHILSQSPIHSTSLYKPYPRNHSHGRGLPSSIYPGQHTFHYRYRPSIQTGLWSGTLPFHNG